MFRLIHVHEGAYICTKEANTFVCITPLQNDVTTVHAMLSIVSDCSYMSSFELEKRRISYAESEYSTHNDYSFLIHKQPGKTAAIIIIIIIYTTYIAPYIWPVWPFIGAEEGPSKY